MHIGLVEDEPAIADMLVAMLELEGHQVRIHSSGHDFLHVLSSGIHYDLLLLDMGLPGGISGLDVLRVLASEQVQLPVLILTATEYDVAQIRALYPVVDLLRKPFRRVVLLACLKQLAVPSQQESTTVE
jgi:two-component system catabolic regulation response regulator CreB